MMVCCHVSDDYLGKLYFAHDKGCMVQASKCRLLSNKSWTDWLVLPNTLVDYMNAAFYATGPMLMNK